MSQFTILIIKCGAAGDVIRTTSILKGLKKKYPSCRITWITSSTNLPLIQHNPLIDVKLALTEHILDELPEFFDLVISLDDELAQCKIAALKGKNKLIGAYLNENNQRTYTLDTEQWFGMGLLRPKEKGGKEKADQLKKENKKTYQQHLSEMLNVEPSEPILVYSEKERSFAQQFFDHHKLKNHDLIIGLNTGAGGRWKYKKLTEEKTAELALQLQQAFGAKVILFGGPEEMERNKKIMHLTGNKVIDAGCHHSLLAFAALLDLCSILISSDSLAMHIGIALKKQVIAFFGPTPSAEIELYGRGAKLIGHVPCIVCYLSDCDVRPTCMDTITPKEIIEQVKQLISYP